MTAAVFAPKLPMVAEAIVSPSDGTSQVFTPPLVWSTSTDSVEPDRPVDFQIQISLNPGFTSIVLDKISFLDNSNFQYESSPDVWTALPSTGLAVSNIGKNVRYVTSLVTHQVYYWRVRVLQQIQL